MATTEDPQPIRRSSIVVDLDGHRIGVGTLLVLRPGDYFWDDDWADPNALRLRISYIGEIISLDGAWFHYVEGEQIEDQRTRARAIAVRVEALAEAAREGRLMEARRHNQPRPPMIFERDEKRQA